MDVPGRQYNEVRIQRPLVVLHFQDTARRYGVHVLLEIANGK